MGSPIDEADRNDNEHQHRVCVEDMLASKYEVTYAQYDAYALATGNELPDDNGQGRANRPVTNVSWIDAMSYVQWLSKKTGKSYRLPTEAEWEYAARGGSQKYGGYKTVYWWGDKLWENRANCKGCISRGHKLYNRGASPVGSFSSNGFGLYDTAGNV